MTASSQTHSPPLWLLALPGLAAVFVGLGIGRFAYTPIIPALIGEGWLPPAQAAYLGAANLAGYLAGAASAHWFGRQFGMARAIRGSLLFCVAACFACALPWGFFWFVPWRFGAGVAGAVIMVLSAPALLARVPAPLRGRMGGIMFTGIGIGIAFAGTAVPWLSHQGVALAWVGLGVAAALLALIGWRGWPADSAAAASTAPKRKYPPALWLLFGAYAADAFGFIPHSLFFVDFVARGLGRGLETGGTYWVVFGCGAAIGPLLYGQIADRLGFCRTMALGLLIKSLAVALPLITGHWFWLGVSAGVVGSLTPGIAMIASGAALELVGIDGHRAAWRAMTLVFGVFQAAGGYALSWVFGRTQDYALLFTIGTGLMVLATLLTAVTAWKRRDSSIV